MIDEYVQRHEHFLHQVLNQTEVPALKIHEAMNYSLFPGGKRMRPVLIYLIGELVHLDLKILDVLAAAVELTHCYSLIHDDLPAMDNDDFRRGKPSCHKAFDEATAILVGDGLQVLAVELLMTHLSPLTTAPNIINITLALVQASGVSGMVSGQSLDLSELSKASLSEHELQKIHELKTGKLISACIEMVLAASPKSSEAIKSALRTYAKHLGLVFQIQDDYMDRYLPATSLGKGRSSDSANQKTTFASLYSQQELEHIIANHYQTALKALEIFGASATTLIKLTQQLQAVMARSTSSRTQ